MRHLVLAAGLAFVVGAGCIFDPQPEPPGADEAEPTVTTTTTATNSSTGGNDVGPPLGGAGGVGGAGGSPGEGLLAGSDRSDALSDCLLGFGGSNGCGSAGAGGEGGT